MTKKVVYVKPIAMEIKTDRKRYMAGGGGYVTNKAITPYIISNNLENDKNFNNRILEK